jgi:hypothetical protein
MTQNLIHRACDTDPGCPALEVFRGKPSLRLHRGSQRRIFTVFLYQ